MKKEFIKATAMIAIFGLAAAYLKRSYNKTMARVEGNLTYIDQGHEILEKIKKNPKDAILKEEIKAWELNEPKGFGRSVENIKIKKSILMLAELVE